MSRICSPSLNLCHVISHRRSLCPSCYAHNNAPHLRRIQRSIIFFSRAANVLPDQTPPHVLRHALQYPAFRLCMRTGCRRWVCMHTIDPQQNMGLCVIDHSKRPDHSRLFVAVATYHTSDTTCALVDAMGMHSCAETADWAACDCAQTPWHIPEQVLQFQSNNQQPNNIPLVHAAPDVPAAGNGHRQQTAVKESCMHCIHPGRTRVSPSYSTILTRDCSHHTTLARDCSHYANHRAATHRRALITRSP